jgi:hypothetical protein
MDQKRIGHLKKSLGMMDMCISLIYKGKTEKKLGRMIAPAHNFDLRQGTSYLIASAVCMWSSGKKNAFDVGGPSSIDFIYF